MSNILLAEIATKHSFSSINEVVVEIKNAKNPVLVLENVKDFSNAVSELEVLSKEYNITILGQLQNSDDSEGNSDEFAINFENKSLDLFNDSQIDEIEDRIKDSDLVLYLGNDIERFQNTLIEENINTYQVTSRKTQIINDEDFITNNFNQINSNEVGFVKVISVM
jgi:hypothetical protein